jgi:hypothetical protein
MLAPNPSQHLESEKTLAGNPLQRFSLPGSRSSGSRPARTSENNPIDKPTATPSAVPRVHPMTSRSRLAPRCFHSIPVRTRSAKAAAACDGAGKAIGLMIP